MKEKTKKNLRKVCLPFWWAWIAIAVAVLMGGLLLEMVAWLLIGKPGEAGKLIKAQFKKRNNERT